MFQIVVIRALIVAANILRLRAGVILHVLL